MTGTTFRVGLIQTRASRSPAANLDAVAKLIGEAKTAGADYVQTPEMTNIMEVSRDKLFATIVPEENDTSLATFRELARNLSIHLHIGSLAVKATVDKAANRAFLIDPRGEIRARYDKIHLFDVDLPTGESWRESSVYKHGSEAVVVKGTPVGTLGLTICYDLRFPALFARLAEAGSDVIAVPAAFTVPTGRAHWEVLLRARAIEAGLFVIAAAQSGHHEDGRNTYGHSLVADPWGELLLDMGDGAGVGFADIELSRITDVRARVPALSHRRLVSEAVTQ